MIQSSAGKQGSLQNLSTPEMPSHGNAKKRESSAVVRKSDDYGKKNITDECNAKYTGPLFLRQHTKSPRLVKSNDSFRSNEKVKESNVAGTVGKPSNKLLDLLMAKTNASKKNGNIQKGSLVVKSSKPESTITASDENKSKVSGDRDTNETERSVKTLTKTKTVSEDTTPKQDNQIIKSVLKNIIIKPKPIETEVKNNITDNKRNLDIPIDNEKQKKQKTDTDNKETYILDLTKIHDSSVSQTEKKLTSNLKKQPSSNNKSIRTAVGREKINISNLVEPMEAPQYDTKIESIYKQDDNLEEKIIPEPKPDTFSEKPQPIDTESKEEINLVSNEVLHCNIEEEGDDDTITINNNIHKPVTLHVTNEDIISSDAKEESEESYSSSEIESAELLTSEYSIENLLVGLESMESRIKNENENKAELAIKKYDSDISKRINRIQFDDTFFHKSRLVDLIKSGVFNHSPLTLNLNVSSTNNISSCSNYQVSPVHVYQNNHKKNNRLKFITHSYLLNEQKNTKQTPDNKNNCPVSTSTTKTDNNKNMDNSEKSISENIHVLTKKDISPKTEESSTKLQWIYEWKTNLKYSHIYFESAKPSSPEDQAVFNAIKYVFEKEFGSKIRDKYSEYTDIVVLNCELSEITEKNFSASLKAALLRKKTTKRVRVWTLGKILKFISNMKIDLNKYIDLFKNNTVSKKRKRRIIRGSSHGIITDSLPATSKPEENVNTTKTLSSQTFKGSKEYKSPEKQFENIPNNKHLDEILDSNTETDVNMINSEHPVSSSAKEMSESKLEIRNGQLDLIDPSNSASSEVSYLTKLLERTFTMLEYKDKLLQEANLKIEKLSEEVLLDQFSISSLKTELDLLKKKIKKTIPH